MHDQITYIMTTYERPVSLERAVRYYKNSKIKIIICDGSVSSSQEIFSTISPDNIEYHHLPGQDPKDRLYFGLARAQTRYVKWVCDDDFFFEEGVLAAVSFLDQNPDFSVCWGVFLGFEVKDLQIRYFLTEPYVLNLCIDPDSSLERIQTFWKTASYEIQHAVVRKEAFVSSLKASFHAATVGGAHNANLHERIQLTALISTGKVRCLNVPFGLRESAPTTMGSESLFIADIVQDPSKHHMLEGFLAGLEVLKAESQLESEADITQLLINSILLWETQYLPRLWKQPTVWHSSWLGGESSARFNFENSSDYAFNIYSADFFSEISKIDFLIRRFAQNQPQALSEIADSLLSMDGAGFQQQLAEQFEKLYHLNPFDQRIVNQLLQMDSIAKCTSQVSIKQWIDKLNFM